MDIRIELISHRPKLAMCVEKVSIEKFKDTTLKNMRYLLPRLVEVNVDKVERALLRQGFYTHLFISRGDIQIDLVIKRLG